MLWRLRRWKISISGGSQAGNWWLPRRIIFSKQYATEKEAAGQAFSTGKAPQKAGGDCKARWEKGAAGGGRK